MLDFDLSPEQEALRRTVREFAERVIAPRAEELDRTGEFPTEIVLEMGKMGLFGIPFPEEYGGAGGDFTSFCLALEEVARVDSSLAITLEAGVSLGASPFHYFGSPEQKKRWLVPMARGEALGAFGLTEPSGGSDAMAIRTTARLERGEWVIDGTKAFITNAGTPISVGVTVAAVTGERPDGRPEISNIFVPTGTPGYHVGRPYRKMGWHASDTRELVFTSCRVPEENLVGGRGEGYRNFMKILDDGRVAIAAMATGLAQGCLDESIKYARERVAFGAPISKHQAIAFKLADMALKVELARLAYLRASWLKDRGRRFKKEASMAKLYASEIAVEVAREAVQIHGGYGYMDEFPVSRHYRDAKVLEIGEGTSEIQRILIARELGL